MKLDQKYFVPFILVVALLTLIVIVLSSFSFQEKQVKQFTEYTAKYDSLLVLPNPFIVEQGDSLRLGSLNGSESVVLFWASWSDRSRSIMEELNQVKETHPDLEIVAALVMDATSSAIPEIPEYDFHYIDGTMLFNEIRVPGIPSYFLLDENGELVETHVGYQAGEVLSIPERFSGQ
jgi:thiol-disulfide isomerase/thioredoxin